MITRTIALTLALVPGICARANAVDSFEKQAETYQTAKAQWLRAQLPKRKKKGAGKAADAPNLLPLLRSFAKLDTARSLTLLSREYNDSNGRIAALAGRALIEDGSEKAVLLALRGYKKSWPLPTKASVIDALVRRGGSDALDFVTKLARSGDVASRALAVTALAERPKRRESLEEAIIPALSATALELRRAALRSIRPFRFKEMIAALIEQVGRERDEALRIDILQLLVDLTDVNVGLDVRDWRKWWEVSEPVFEFQTSSKGRTKLVTPDLEYFGIEIASKRIAFLVDASNSMLRAPGAKKKGRGADGKRKIDVLKKELTRILEKLPAETMINMLFFHASIVPWKKELHSLRGRGRAEAIDFVTNIQCAFGTNIYDTLERALEDRRVDTIYMLSDGQPYGGKFTKPADILREIGAINRVRGAKIHCIAFGNDSALLRDLAAQNGGTYRSTAPRKKGGRKGKK